MAELDELTNRLTNVEGRLSTLTNQTGPWAQIKRIGLLVALIGGVLGGGNTVLQLIDTLYTHPDSRFIQGFPIDISFDRATAQFDVEFPFTLLNEGNADEVIGSISGRLRGPEGNSYADFDPTVTLISEKGEPINTPFTVNKAASRDLVCRLTYRVVQGDEIPSEEGKWVLEITIRGVEAVIDSSVETFLDADAIADVFEGRPLLISNASNF